MSDQNHAILFLTYLRDTHEPHEHGRMANAMMYWVTKFDCLVVQAIKQATTFESDMFKQTIIEMRNVINHADSCMNNITDTSLGVITEDFSILHDIIEDREEILAELEKDLSITAAP